jgi:hypothetical protein
MTQITLDAELSRKLQGMSDITELCDPLGRVLGRFVPAMQMADWEPLSPDVSEEELDRREHSDERRYTTTEVISHLENL